MGSPEGDIGSLHTVLWDLTSLLLRQTARSLSRPSAQSSVLACYALPEEGEASSCARPATPDVGSSGPCAGRWDGGCFNVRTTSYVLVNILLVLG